MRTARLVPILVLAVLLASDSHAQSSAPAGENWGGDEKQASNDSKEFSRDGFYVSYGYSYGIEEWDDAGGASVSNASGLNARVGYRFLENWALEAEYEWLHEFEADGASPVTANAHVITVNTRAYLPFGRFQPYALLGLGLFQSSRTGSLGGVPDGASGTFAGRFGGGVDTYLTRNWVLAAEIAYVLPSGELNPRRFLSATVGMQYRFEPLVY
ncbi:porin family protein [Myxococcota bacterium]|nr:porin family protein [Myxococcota bacterium]